MERVSSSETSDPTPKNDESENSAEIISEIEQEIDERLEELSRQSTERGTSSLSHGGPNLDQDDKNSGHFHSCHSNSTGNENLINQTNEIDENDLGTHQKCPEEEINFRIENELVHKFEMTNGVPDRNKMVKEYRRSSADNLELSKPESMRSKRGLWNTVSYLLSDVLSIETYGFVEKYDFISDRLRAVRQELTIQRLTNTWTGCQILLSCCNFYLVSRRFFYDLKDVERAVDRPHFNEKHLHECMGSMIVFLQQLSTDELFGNELKTTREALSVLLLSSLDALHASSAIYRLIFEILADLREHGILLQPLQLTKSFVTRNWCRFARVFHRLSLIQQMTVEPFVATIRKHCFESTIMAFHNQKLPLSKFASWMLLSQAEVRELIAESSGITIDTDDVTISFNKKELSFPPDDIFNTRAAGKLSTRALIDVCQLRDTVKNVELAPLISEITQLDLEEEPKEKYSVSTNPLDIANDSDSDSDSVPIWMRKKSQKSNRENRGNRRRDSDRSGNHRRDSEKSERRHSDRSDHRENNREKSNGSTFHWSEGGDRRYRNSRSGKNRDRDRRSGKEGRGGRGKGKVDSTASRSWQHDDRTRTSY